VNVHIKLRSYIVFSSCALDPNIVTFTYEPKDVPVNIKNEIPRSRLSKGRARSA